MTIEQTHSSEEPLPRVRFLSSSHRTFPEQLVGLGIYFLVCLGFSFFTHLATGPLAVLYALCLALSMWTLWRRYSLRVLKLELSVFLSQFVFQTAWSLSNAFLKVEILSLATLLLLWSNILLSALLFWRKEQLSSWLLLFPFLWVFYLAGYTMLAR